MLNYLRHIVYKFMTSLKCPNPKGHPSGPNGEAHEGHNRGIPIMTPRNGFEFGLVKCQPNEKFIDKANYVHTFCAALLGGSR